MSDQPMPLRRLSLLDFGWVGAGQSAAQSLRDTFTLAKRAEALGVTRYWVGEHHLERHACGSPQILAAILAASTRRLRIGVGAMLLQYWSALKLAEDFRLLEAVFGRIDLGVGRGGADNLKSHLALLDGKPVTEGMLAETAYRNKLDDLVGLLRGSLAPDHALAGAAVIPELDVRPQLWICGAETAGIQAARLGAHFCCTLFHGRMPDARHVAAYRAKFVPSPELSAPACAIAVCGVCTETQARAQEIQAQFPHRNYLPNVVGTPEYCRTRLQELCTQYQADEVVFLDMAPELESRVRSLELLAQALELSAARDESAKSAPRETRNLQHV